MGCVGWFIRLFSIWQSVSVAFVLLYFSKEKNNKGHLKSYRQSKVALSLDLSLQLALL